MNGKVEFTDVPLESVCADCNEPFARHIVTALTNSPYRNGLICRDWKSVFRLRTDDPVYAYLVKKYPNKHKVTDE